MNGKRKMTNEKFREILKQIILMLDDYGVPEEVLLVIIRIRSLI